MDKKVDTEALEERVNKLNKTVEERVNKLNETVDYHHSFIEVLAGKNSTKVGVED